MTKPKPRHHNNTKGNLPKFVRRLHIYKQDGNKSENESLSQDEITAKIGTEKSAMVSRVLVQAQIRPLMESAIIESLDQADATINTKSQNYIKETSKAKDDPEKMNNDDNDNTPAPSKRQKHDYLHEFLSHENNTTKSFPNHPLMLPVTILAPCPDSVVDQSYMLQWFVQKQLESQSISQTKNSVVVLLQVNKQFTTITDCITQIVYKCFTCESEPALRRYCLSQYHKKSHSSKQLLPLWKLWLQSTYTCQEIIVLLQEPSKTGMANTTVQDLYEWFVQSRSEWKVPISIITFANPMYMSSSCQGKYGIHTRQVHVPSMDSWLDAFWNNERIFHLPLPISIRHSLYQEYYYHSGSVIRMIMKVYQLLISWQYHHPDILLRFPEKIIYPNWVPAWHWVQTNEYSIESTTSHFIVNSILSILANSSMYQHVTKLNRSLPLQSCDYWMERLAKARAKVNLFQQASNDTTNQKPPLFPLKSTISNFITQENDPQFLNDTTASNMIPKLLQDLESCIILLSKQNNDDQAENKHTETIILELIQKWSHNAESDKWLHDIYPLTLCHLRQEMRDALVGPARLVWKEQQEEHEALGIWPLVQIGFMAPPRRTKDKVVLDRTSVVWCLQQQGN